MPCPGAGVRNRKPAGLRNPRRGGLLGAQTELFTWRFRECALPGVEVRRPFRLVDGVPARPCRAKRGAGILCAGVVGGPNPACGPHAKKSPRPFMPRRGTPAKTHPRRARPGKQRRFVKVVHFLLGAKFAELRPGKGGS